MTATILIVDDKQSVFESLALNFSDYDFAPLWAVDSRDALAALVRERIDAVLLDLSLGCESGIDLLALIKRDHPAIPVIMITGYGTLELAVKSIKLGAYDFLPKPLDFDRLRGTVEQALEVTAGKTSDPDPLSRNDDLFVSQSPVLRDLYRRATILAKTDLPVLVTGESGTGKEHLVDLIHASSSRSGGTMERINCSAFPEALIDNELFGHEKGAFTGAGEAYAGIFERADGGTLHLDEVGDLALSSQARLLRVLEDGMVRRLGGGGNVAVDVRVIASTNRDLPEMIRAGQFRRDLFYRLNAAYLYIPPLRERRGDIAGLLDHFLDRHPGEDGWCRRFSAAALAILETHSWPGNVRELKNLVRTSVLMAASRTIEPRDLPPDIGAGPDATASESEEAKPLDGMEREHILRTLKRNRYNKTRTSEELGIDRKTLYNKMKCYGLA